MKAVRDLHSPPFFKSNNLQKLEKKKGFGILRIGFNMGGEN
jgi:hypothetical protein